MTKDPEYRTLYRQENFPVFQNRMYPSREAGRACARGDIHLVEDLKTGLVYNLAFDPSLVRYDSDYQNEQANSTSFRAHLDGVAELVIETMGRADLIEVGCGKGTFLELLEARGADIRGFDPTYEGDHPRIARHLFAPGIGLEGKGLILRHVLEHIPEPVAFLTELARANGGSGLVYIEVPCFDWIARHGAWFDIFYEHVNYFRLSDFHRMFGRVRVAETCFGGQYLRVVADLSSLRRPVYDPGDPVHFPVDLVARVTAEAGDGDPADVVWGGASKGVIYALLRERAGRPVARVIDINPGKQGRYLAGSGLRVEAPDAVLPELSPDARILVMNPNYISEIREMSGNAFTYIQVSHE